MRLEPAHGARHQRTVAQLAQEPGNDRCADCHARGVQWANTALGVFLCRSCATVHRLLPARWSNVKSIATDAWTREDIQRLQGRGNLRSNAQYLPEPARYPPPTDMNPEERGELAKYIQQKYEQRRFAKVLATQTRPANTVSNGCRRDVLTQQTRPRSPEPPATRPAAGGPPSGGGPPRVQMCAPSTCAAPSAVPAPPAARPEGIYADLLDLQDGPALYAPNPMPTAYAPPGYAAPQPYGVPGYPMQAFPSPFPPGAYAASGHYASSQPWHGRQPW